MQLSPFKAVLPNLDAIAAIRGFNWNEVKEHFKEFEDQGLYHPADVPAIFLLEIKQNDKVSTGLVVNIDFDDLRAGRVKPHENTIAADVEKQIQLMQKRGNAIKPLLLVHPSHQAVRLAILRAKAAFPYFFEVKMEDGSSHKVYQINESEYLEALITAYKRYVPQVYIADGHHRAASALQLVNAGMDPKPVGMFSVLMTDDQVQILDYSRWVIGLNGLSGTELLEAIAQFCHIEPLEIPEKPQFAYGMTMLLKKKWYSLFWRPSFLVERFNTQDLILSPQLLNDFIIGPLLGVTDIRRDKRLQYIDGTQGAAGLLAAAKQEKGVGFMLHPLEIGDVYTAADKGISLPPKSTWFEPRIKNGVIAESWSTK